ncbi:DUF4269 domain-containing protein [Cytobacillus sp. IB215665]|uniref:DUF4269 domain-containing protein n=1 Tax=Cytobacillus sp. IB215665 TaxID=3097357 RepID=UPI002A0DBABF|nr:DUF4269 domain-containing protein [Cytobacillus sp. IB215665]MDX8364497.1 DUF4269 domain-containing protein [Cytobacillus sp. IB215665]
MYNSLLSLKMGTVKQRKAYSAIENLGIMNDLVEYDPVVCGTIPIGVDVIDSDLDIIMEVDHLHKQRFENKVKKLYGNEINFKIVRKNIRNLEVVKANFIFYGFEFEIFGQSQPVLQQYAYQHMVIERFILEEFPSIRQQVVNLKIKGYKTEPAFCEILGLSGDSYEALLNYGREKGII